MNTEPDHYTAVVRSYAIMRRVTHRVTLDGAQIGRVWSDGTIEIDEPTPTAPQVPRSSMGGAP